MKKVFLLFCLAFFSILGKSQEQDTTTIDIVYVMDPMCSWCYGFSSEIEKLKQKYDTLSNINFMIIAGGLRPYNTKVMDSKMKKFLKSHWEHINKKTGQPFSYTLFNRNDFIYNTEPADRAVVTMRNLYPNKTFAFIQHLQHEFYAKNTDITDTNVVAKLGDSFLSNSSTKFSNYFHSDKAKKQTYKDFEKARDLHATSFPTVLLKQHSKTYTVTIGFQTFQKMDKRIQEQINENKK